MEFRRALETEVGVERKSPTDSHLSPGLLSHEPSPSQLRSPGSSTSSPPTCTGQTLHPCRVHTPAPERISLMVRGRPLPLTRPAPLQPGLRRNLLESGGLRARSSRAASSNPGRRRAAGYRFTQADHCASQPITHTTRLSSANCLRLGWSSRGPPAGTGVKLVCTGTWQFWVGRWVKKVGGKENKRVSSDKSD